VGRQGIPEIVISAPGEARNGNGRRANKAERANESLNEISFAEARGDAKVREVSIPRMTGKRRPFDTADAAAAAAN